MASYIIGVDPGREKCGLAVLDSEGVCVHRAVVQSSRLEEALAELASRYLPQAVVLGDRTAAGEFRQRMLSLFQEQQVPIHMVAEHLSSQEGRRDYLLAHRRGLRRLIPLGLQWPREPYDDYVAEVLVRRYLERTER